MREKLQLWLVVAIFAGTLVGTMTVMIITRG